MFQLDPRRGFMQQRVLIVEDNNTSRRALARLLQAEGHLILQARDLQEAAVMLREQLDCILLDLDLPDGCGSSLLRELRGQGSRVRVAITSATRQKDLLDQAQDLRATVFSKPLNLPTILDWVADKRW
jgi:DNA-binding response OmpR family regulator